MGFVLVLGVVATCSYSRADMAPGILNITSTNVELFNSAKSVAPGILNIGTTDVHALNSAESVAHIFDPKNLANVSGGRTNKLALTSCW